jgi:hypothetical protein
MSKDTGKYLVIVAVIIAIAALLISCGEKMKLPTTAKSVAFGSGDTTYIHLAPDWTVNNGTPLSEPCDIVVGPDGFVFVADRGNNRIACFDRTGGTIGASWTSGLDNLETLPSAAPGSAIEAIGQDEKLNLYMVMGDTIVWQWNQYLNQIGVQAVMEYLTVFDTLEMTTTDISFIEWIELSNEAPDRYEVVDISYSFDPERIDSVLAPRIFYHEPQAKFRGVAGGPNSTMYVCDEYDEIIRINVQFHNLVMLDNGFLAYTYFGERDRVVATSGTGMGTTNEPAGIYIQVQGGQHFIYWTQTGLNFMAQKLREEGVGNFFSAFGPDTDFMQLERYAHPMDIWVAEQYLGNNWIFVADTDANRVQVFNPVGDFLMHAGERISTSGEVIFEDGFSSGNLNKWTVLGGTGTWEVTDGEMWGHNNEAEISPNTGELTNYIFTTDCRFEDGQGWGIDFRYINQDNRIRLDFTPGQIDQLNVNIYENGQLVAQPYEGTCTKYGSDSTQHYCRFVVDGPYFEVYFGNDPEELDRLCAGTWEQFTSGIIRYQVWGDESTVSSYFDNVLVTTLEVDGLFQPEGVAHFEGILYVADTGNDRIVRYALSTDVENIPGQ